LNLYTYCQNNPISYTDPSGHKKETSVVDYLKSQKEDSSFAARKELAKDNGIKNYTGTADQNTQLLNKLKNKEAADRAAAEQAAAKKAYEEKVAAEKRAALKVNKEKASDVVVTRLNDYFLPIIKVTDNDVNIYYGGNQEWLSEETQQDRGCGVVASANILAYMAMKDPELSTLYGYNSLSKKNYTNFMGNVNDYVYAISTGVGAYDFVKDTKSYAKDKGIKLSYEEINMNSGFGNVVDFITEAIQNDHPVAFLDYFDTINYTETDSTTGDYYAHWVVITGILENRTTGDVTLEISSWGEKLIVNLNEVYEDGNRANPNISLDQRLYNTLFPQKFIYFEATK
jgi:hypothetical protein